MDYQAGSISIGSNPIGQYGSDACRRNIGYRSLPCQRHRAWKILTPKLITMAKLAKKKQTGKGLRSEVVNSNAAGIDISPKEMQVCVPVYRDRECNRKFGVYTKDLHEIVQ